MSVMALAPGHLLDGLDGSNGIHHHTFRLTPIQRNGFTVIVPRFLLKADDQVALDPRAIGVDCSRYDCVDSWIQGPFHDTNPDIVAVAMPEKNGYRGLEIRTVRGQGVAIQSGSEFVFEKILEVPVKDLTAHVQLPNHPDLILFLKTTENRYAKCHLSLGAEGMSNQPMTGRAWVSCVMSRPNDPFVGYPSPVHEHYLTMSRKYLNASRKSVDRNGSAE